MRLAYDEKTALLGNIVKPYLKLNSNLEVVLKENAPANIIDAFNEYKKLVSIAFKNSDT